MLEKSYRWGIIAPGRIAHKFAQALDAVPDGHLHAVLSRDADRAKGFAVQYGASASTDSLDRFLNELKPDAAYIASPHTFHYDQALACLEAGIPVLCEKPLTVNARQAQQLIDASRNNGVFLMEAVWTRFLPIYTDIRKWLVEGRIGPVSLITSTFGFKAPRNLKDRVFNPDLAGGALLDIGIYNLTVSQWIMGREPSSFSADGVLGETGVDELLSVNLRYGAEQISQFSCSVRTDLANECVISGDQGRITIHPRFWNGATATLLVGDHTETVTRPFLRNGFEYQIEEVQRCLSSGVLESPAIPHSDTLNTMKLMDAIRADIGVVYPFE